ncbi:hypothetical protein GUITHDRAFT_101496 [Guillardia theta CCMP2712]|uniref:UVR domain-containing protein n=2 Tax=Guillardia theta TaxID=55529 RepID=L1JXF8_GUITC|nr:hypothetical protein GUITHDRAFT_101496 [Guillardia theta CCMP2712]EKX53052.1 hypothetical protein GUITHDRAFT_101496 [Guillardia theta CCMP2712]|eukprot:XP_005840032.1 hypothetical protein GUITHDRAFT_101496 [Guillardia theta CCMP2712]
MKMKMEKMMGAKMKGGSAITRLIVIAVVVLLTSQPLAGSRDGNFGRSSVEGPGWRRRATRKLGACLSDGVQTLRLTGGGPNEEGQVQRNAFESFLSFLSLTHQKEARLLAYDTVIYIMDQTIKMLVNRNQDNSREPVIHYSIEMEERIAGPGSPQGAEKVMEFLSSIGLEPIGPLASSGTEKKLRLQRICDITVLRDSRRIALEAMNDLRLRSQHERHEDAMDVEEDARGDLRASGDVRVELLEKEMQKAASELRFEDAAKLRDALEVLRRQSSDSNAQQQSKSPRVGGAKPNSDFPCTSGIRKSSNSPPGAIGARKPYQRPSPTLWPQNDNEFQDSDSEKVDPRDSAMSEILKQAKEAMNKVADDELNIRQAALASEKKLKELVSAKKDKEKVSTLLSSLQLLHGIFTRVRIFAVVLENSRIIPRAYDRLYLYVRVTCTQSLDVYIPQCRTIYSLLASTTTVTDYPEEVYDFNAKDLLLCLESNKRRYEESSQLMTRKMREARHSTRKNISEPGNIRIRFGDGCFLQGTFDGDEKISSIFHFVSASLKERRDFTLKTVPPVKYLEKFLDNKIADMNLFPNGIVNVLCKEGAKLIREGIRDDIPLQMQG